MTEAKTLNFNAEYLARRETWREWQALIDGIRDELISSWALWKHQIEMEKHPSAAKLLESRALRTRYLNLPEVVRSVWISMFFADDYNLTDEGRRLLGENREYAQNITSKNENLGQWMKLLTEDYLTFGRGIPIVTRTTEAPRTIADEKLPGSRPKLDLLHPLCVKDWSFKNSVQGERKELAFLRYEYVVSLDRARAIERQTLQIRSDELYLEGANSARQVWSGSSYHVEDQLPNIKLDERAGWIQEGAPILGGLTRIPVHIMEGESWLKDVFEETLRFYNLRSSHDSILHNQGFQRSWLAVTDASDPALQTAVMEALVGLVPQGTVLIQSQPVDVSGHREALKESLSAVMKLGLNQVRILPADSKVSQGADTQEAERRNTRELVSSTKQEIEDAANIALGFYDEYMGGSAEGKKYLTLNTDIKDDRIEEFEEVMSSILDELQKYPKARKELATRGAKILDMSEETLKAIESDERDPEPTIVRPSLSALQAPKPPTPVPGNVPAAA